MATFWRVLTVSSLIALMAITAAMARQVEANALQIDPCATTEPTLEPPTETTTSEPTSTPDPTSTDEPTSTPDPTSTDEPTSTPDPTSTAQPTLTATFAPPNVGSGAQPGDLASNSEGAVLFIQVAGTDPCETPSVEPTVEPTLDPATEEPTIDPTASPTEEAVTQLPNTGSGTDGSNPIGLLLLIIGSACLLVLGLRKVTTARL